MELGELSEPPDRQTDRQTDRQKYYVTLAAHARRELIRQSKIALKQTLALKLGVTLVMTVTKVYVFINLRRVIGLPRASVNGAIVLSSIWGSCLDFARARMITSSWCVLALFAAREFQPIKSRNLKTGFTGGCGLNGIACKPHLP